MKYTLLKNRLTGDRAVYVSGKGSDYTGYKVCENVQPEEYMRLRKLAISNRNKAEKYQCMKDLGLTPYKTLSGSTAWE